MVVLDDFSSVTDPLKVSNIGAEGNVKSSGDSWAVASSFKSQSQYSSPSRGETLAAGPSH